MGTQDLVKNIGGDTSSGASEIMRMTVESLLLMSDRLASKNPGEYFDTMVDFGCDLISAQPAMAPVFNTVNSLILHLESVVGKESTVQFRQRTRYWAEGVVTSSDEALSAIHDEVWKLIGVGQTILTHSYSSTAIGSMVHARKNGREFSVIATESRPHFEGRRTARILSDSGIGVTLIADMAAFSILEECHMVITGSDSLCKEGVVNKIGTRGLAAGASRVGVPFYIVSETSKVLPAAYLQKPVIPDMGPQEVWEESDDVAVKNIYFDITEHGLFKGYITEKGIIGYSEVLEMINKAEVSGRILERLA